MLPTQVNRSDRRMSESVRSVGNSCAARLQAYVLIGEKWNQTVVQLPLKGGTPGSLSVAVSSVGGFSVRRCLAIECAGPSGKGPVGGNERLLSAYVCSLGAVLPYSRWGRLVRIPSCRQVFSRISPAIRPRDSARPCNPVIASPQPGRDSNRRGLAGDACRQASRR